MYLNNYKTECRLNTILPNDLCGDIFKYAYGKTDRSYIDEIINYDLNIINNHRITLPKLMVIDLLHDAYKNQDDRLIDLILTNKQDADSNIFEQATEILMDNIEYNALYMSNYRHPYMDMVRYMTPDQYDQFKTRYFNTSDIYDEPCQNILYPDNLIENKPLYEAVLKDIKQSDETECHIFRLHCALRTYKDKDLLQYYDQIKWLFKNTTYNDIKWIYSEIKLDMISWFARYKGTALWGVLDAFIPNLEYNIYHPDKHKKIKANQRYRN